MQVTNLNGVFSLFKVSTREAMDSPRIIVYLSVDTIFEKGLAQFLLINPSNKSVQFWPNFSANRTSIGQLPYRINAC